MLIVIEWKYKILSRFYLTLWTCLGNFIWINWIKNASDSKLRDQKFSGHVQVLKVPDHVTAFLRLWLCSFWLCVQALGHAWHFFSLYLCNLLIICGIHWIMCSASWDLQLCMHMYIFLRINFWAGGRLWNEAKITFL